MAEGDVNLDNPAIIPDYDGKPMTALPYDMIVKIYDELDYGSPEALSATCTGMKSVFHNLEDHLKLPVAGELALCCWKNEIEVTKANAMKILKKYQNPTLSQFKRLLRFTKVIRIKVDSPMPWFTNATAPDYDKLKEFLLDCNVKCVYIDMEDPKVSTSDSVLVSTFDLFPENTYRFLQQAGEIVGGTRHQEMLTGYHGILPMTVPKFYDLLLKNKNLQNLNVSLDTEIDGRVNLEEYAEEWKAGERTIKRWSVRLDFRSLPREEIYHDRIKDGEEESLIVEKKWRTVKIGLARDDIYVENNVLEEYAANFIGNFDPDPSDSDFSDFSYGERDEDEEKEEEEEVEEEEEEEKEDVDVHDEEEEEEEEDAYSGCEEYDRDDDDDEEEEEYEYALESDADDEEENEEDEEDEDRERYW